MGPPWNFIRTKVVLAAAGSDRLRRRPMHGIIYLVDGLR